MNSSEYLLRLVVNIISLIILVSGVILALISRKLPINPFLGFRIGYVYISRNIWIKMNKLAGVVFAFLGAIFLVMPYIIDALVTLILMLFSIIAVTMILIEYASKIAELELIKLPAKERATKLERIEPLYPSIPIIALLVVSISIFLYSLIVLYPQLPEVVAVHFSLSGAPDRYGSKIELLAASIAGPALFYTLLAYFTYLGVKRPEAFYKPWLKPIEVRRYALSLITALALGSIIVTIAIYDAIYYNLTNTHVVPLLPTTTVMILALLVIIAYMLLVIVKAYRRSRYVKIP